MIEIINQQHRYWINKFKFKSLLKKLVVYYGLKNYEISLVFVNTRTIKNLNHRFLKRNSPTDVLSFPIREKGPDGKFYLGDIIISAPTAFNQCFLKKYGMERELEYLTIHGLLHLLGFEHFGGMEEEEEKIIKLFL